MEIQGRTGLGVKILVVLLAPVILYWGDLSIVAGEALKSDISTHILALPFLLAYILYRIRRVFSASTSQTSTFTILRRPNAKNHNENNLRLVPEGYGGERRRGAGRHHQFNMPGVLGEEIPGSAVSGGER